MVQIQEEKKIFKMYSKDEVYPLLLIKILASPLTFLVLESLITPLTCNDSLVWEINPLPLVDFAMEGNLHSGQGECDGHLFIAPTSSRLRMQ